MPAHARVMICASESYFTNSVAKQILHYVSSFFCPQGRWSAEQCLPNIALGH